MKTKICTLFIILCAIGFNAFGQGLYFKVGGSYALPMGSQSLIKPIVATNSVVGQSTVVTLSTESVKGSYGAGIYTGFSIGYKFSPFIGIDLNVSYLLGKEYEGSSVGSNNGNTTVTLDSLTKCSGIFISPTALFMIGGGKVRPYALVGITTGTVKIEDTTVGLLGVRDNGITFEEKRETKGDYAFGFRGGAGLDFNVASKVSIYAEVIFNAISYYANESEVTVFEIDNVDQLSDLNVRQKATVYVDKVTATTIDGNEVIDDNKPKEELRKPLPLSSLSFGVGVKYRLSVD